MSFFIPLLWLLNSGTRGAGVGQAGVTLCDIVKIIVSLDIRCVISDNIHQLSDFGHCTMDQYTGPHHRRPDIGPTSTAIAPTLSTQEPPDPVLYAIGNLAEQVQDNM